MRRGLGALLALSLCVGGVTACGGDDGSDSADGTTTTPPDSTSSTSVTPATVDAFCAKSDEFAALVADLESNGGEPPSTADQERLSALGGEVARMMMELQGTVSQMLPGDTVRFQECAAMFGGG